MLYLNLFRAASVVYVVALLALGAIAQAGPDGEEITDPQERLWYVLSASLLTIAGLVCWLGSVRFWLHRRRAGIAHVIGAIVLVPYGLLVGWLYLLVARDPRER